MGKESVKVGNGIVVSRRKGEEGGYVLITMAIAAFALVGVMGVAVDIGRMFIVKNETQAFCDAAALAASLQLDGTTTGIAHAKTAVTNSTNTWNFNTATISNPTVTFATTSAGPWVANPNPATLYAYAQVSATVSEQLYFIPVIVTQTTQNVVSAAIAGQVALTNFPRGLAPYTAVSTNTTGPDFGLIVGNSYDIQWPQFSTLGTGGCTSGNPDACFNKPACLGDPSASKLAVVSSWGSNTSGYWGSTSNNTIQQEILDLIQTASIDITNGPYNIQPVLSSGTKESEAGYLDQRASEDTDTTDNTPSDYFAAAHNGRRLLAVPVVDPVDATHTNVIGFGQFLLLANGPGTSTYYQANSQGNSPYCAIYVGTYLVGGTGTGVPGVGSSGAVRVKLLQ